MSKLVIIDGHAIMHRAFHALPPLTTRAGEPINAVYGFTSMLLRIITDLKPTHLAIAFDRKEKTFRQKVYKDYQSHRPETHEDLVSQFEKARDTASAMAIPVYSKAGYEADDIIGTLSRKVKIDKIVIVTGDKDILQLIDKKVRVYLPVRGLSNADLVGEGAVVMKLGVTADQVVDYKALVGDPSDNYKGVPGVGPKTATDLLSKYKTLELIYSNLDKLPDTVATKLKAGKKSALMSQKLAKIVTNVSFEYNLEEMSKWQLDSDKLLNLFAEYGFRTLTKRIKNLSEKLEREKQMTLI